MKHPAAVKFLVIFLTACMLVVATGGAAGIIYLNRSGLYSTNLVEKQEQWFADAGQSIAWQYATRYAADTLGNCSDALLDHLYPEANYVVDPQYWAVTLRLDDKVVDKSQAGLSGAITMEYTITSVYPVASTTPPVEPTEPSVPEEEVDPTDPTEETVPEVPEPEDDYLNAIQTPIYENGEIVNYYLRYYQGPTYHVTVQIQPEELSGAVQTTLRTMYPYRYAFILVLFVGVFLSLAGLAFLAWTAGRRKDGTAQLVFINRLPADLLLLIGGGLSYIFLILVADVAEWTRLAALNVGMLGLMGALVLGIALNVVLLTMAISAQIRMGESFILKHSLVGRGVSGLRVLLGLLPLVWQVVTVAAAAGGVLALGILLARKWLYGNIVLIAAVALCVALALYLCYALGLLMAGVRRMTRGQLDHKIETRYLRGGFRTFAQELNELSEVAVQAARKQMKAERMRSELITNVSHDIKTPLTSIINFVDLLQKSKDPQEQKQYLDILSRQSGRMKKLIDDLMELSKASSGNMSVNLTELDAVETVNQALGEFSDKLEKVSLEPVFHQPAEPVLMLADGRLVWRVLSNLLSNAVKYAMPCTRLYVELSRKGDWVNLSLKNVSKEALNLSAEELMERFVRGETSRSSEGSGLGLNIAKSLMEVQKGKLQLVMEADLFKVELSFPAVKNS